MDTMTEQTDEMIVAYCGLVCSNCGAYRKGRCQGCHSDKPMNRNCTMKACARKREYTTCADCTDHTNLKDCKKLNNLFSKFFGFIFRTDRFGNLERIREAGLEQLKTEKRKEGKA